MEKITLSMMMPSIRSKRQVKHGKSASSGFHENMYLLNNPHRFKKSGPVEITPYITFVRG
jgi:hypothetical protein